MKSKKSLTLILTSFFLPLLAITSLHATVFFEFDGEKGYQYMGSGSPHPGGGYFTQMGGNINSPVGTTPTSGGCTKVTGKEPGPGEYNTDIYHYTHLSNDVAAQGSIPGSQYALKTDYNSNCTGEHFQKDTTLINFGQPLSEYYIRWYQKWTGNFYNANIQQKFFKPEPDIAVGGGIGLAQITFNRKGLNQFRATVPNIDGHFDKDGVTRAAFVWVNATRAGMPGPGGEYPGTPHSYDDDGTTTSEFTFSTNTWYCIEVHTKVNTEGNSDGIMEVWVNGIKVIGIYNFKYYSGTASGVRYVEMQHIYYNRDAVDEPTYMDNIVISDSYIGPIGVQPAPSPPTGLKIVQ